MTDQQKKVGKVAAKASSSRRRVAGRAAAKAKRAGAVGDSRKKGRGWMPAYQRALRDSAIVARVAAGARHADVAEEFSVTQRTIERVVADFRSAPSPMDQRPMEIVEGLLRTYRKAVGDFEALAFAYAESHPSAAIQAKRQMRECLSDYWLLLAELGKLPRDLQMYRGESEQNEVARRMRAMMEQLAAGEVSTADAFEEFDRLMRPSTPLWDIEGEAREIEPPADDEAA